MHDTHECVLHLTFHELAQALTLLGTLFPSSLLECLFPLQRHSHCLSAPLLSVKGSQTQPSLDGIGRGHLWSIQQQGQSLFHPDSPFLPWVEGTQAPKGEAEWAGPSGSILLLSFPGDPRSYSSSGPSGQEEESKVQREQRLVAMGRGPWAPTSTAGVAIHAAFAYRHSLGAGAAASGMGPPALPDLTPPCETAASPASRPSHLLASRAPWPSLPCKAVPPSGFSLSSH